MIEYLRRAPEIPESSGREVQIGGPDILSYGDMLDRMAVAMERRPRLMIPVPLITPWLSSLWIGLVTPVDTNVARPLVEGLKTATVVTDPSGADPFGIAPAPFRRDLAKGFGGGESEALGLVTTQYALSGGRTGPTRGSVRIESSGTRLAHTSVGLAPNDASHDRRY